MIDETDYYSAKSALSDAGCWAGTLFESVSRLIRQRNDVRSQMIGVKLQFMVEMWHNEGSDCRLNTWLGATEAMYAQWVEGRVSDFDFYNQCDQRSPGHEALKHE